MLDSSEEDIDGTFRRELTSLLPYARALARSLWTGNVGSSDDLAQDAVERAWRARRSLTLGTNMKAWLTRLLRNEFYSDKRRSWRSVQLDSETAEQTLVAADDPQATLDLNSVRQALATLLPARREALILIGVAGLDHETVAGILDCRVGTVKSRVSRAGAALSQALEHAKYERDGLRACNAMDALEREANRVRSGVTTQAR